jgi:hypothetical protein
MGNIFSDCCNEDKIENQSENDTRIPLLDNEIGKNWDKNKKVRWNDEKYYDTLRNASNIRKKYKKSKSW